MRFSFNWLKRHLRTGKSISEIANMLTFIGLEVEEVIDCDEIFKNFVIAKAKNVQKHPNADKLRVCEAVLKDGTVKHIVCGASNLREGLNVILALPGAKIPATGEILKQSKIRGISSEGMFCSLEELGLAEDSDGIIELPDDVSLDEKIGTLVGLGEGIIDISITPNRGDCFSIEGVARDLAAVGAGEFIEEEKTCVNEDFKFDININLVDNQDNSSILEAMPFCAYRIIRGIKNVKSPEWLIRLLESANVNSISSVVDFANFMTYDVCRPFHIYDLKKIGNELSLRQANNGEVFRGLNRKEYSLNSDVIVASSSDHIMCILGIMGSEKCACDETTTDILIEASVFNPIYISNTGNKMNIISDSRTRFERGINSEYTRQGLDRLTNYILQNCGGKASSVFTIGNDSFKRKKVTLYFQKVNKIAGIEIDCNDVIGILEKLQIKILSKDRDFIVCEIPPFRSDLNIAEDLVEEVLRIKGYDLIPYQALPGQKTKFDASILNKYKKITEIKRELCAKGLSELNTFSFINNDQAKLFMSDLVHTSQQTVIIANPISEDLSIMRNSLYPGLLSNVDNLLKLSAKSVCLFELGPIFSTPDVQRTSLNGVRCGHCNEKNWIDSDRCFDAFDVKSDVLQVLKMFNISEDKISYDTDVIPEWYHPMRSSAIVLSKKIVGYFGELHPSVLAHYDIKVPCVGFELDIDQLFAVLKPRFSDYNSCKPLPFVERDFSFVFDDYLGKHFRADDLVRAIKKSDPLVQHVGIFDYYKIADESVAIGVTVTIRPQVTTLNEADIREIYDKIVIVAKNVGCELRQ